MTVCAAASLARRFFRRPAGFTRPSIQRPISCAKDPGGLPATLSPAPATAASAMAAAMELICGCGSARNSRSSVLPSHSSSSKSSGDAARLSAASSIFSAVGCPPWMRISANLAAGSRQFQPPQPRSARRRGRPRRLLTRPDASRP